MNAIALFVVSVMLLLPAGEEPRNPWKEKVPAAVEKVERARTATSAAYGDALDVTWRADAWQEGLKLARAALDCYPDQPMLRGRIARALWRGGEIHAAEQVVDRIAEDTWGTGVPAGRDLAGREAGPPEDLGGPEGGPPEALPEGTKDRVALTALAEIELARGNLERASAAARRLEELGPKSAAELYHVVALRMAEDRLAGIVPLVRALQRRVDPENGYPDIYLQEALEGLPEFFAAIGSEPINQVVHYGLAEMPMIAVIRLPYCLAMINGAGPYRLILDTGGSITLSLDDDVARELGLKSLGKASIRGISGKQDSEQTLVDELRIGEITCRRVMTRTFELPEIMTLAADGIIGTGIFARERITLDFEHARLALSPSSDEAARGHAAEVRVVGDAKLLALVKLEDEPAVALLDSGADVAAISPLRLQRLFPDRPLTIIPAAGMGVGEGAAAGISLGPGVKLEAWGRTYENYSGVGLEVLDTLLGPILGVQTHVLLGMPIFRDMNSWTVDYPRRRMWVDWIGD
jgi:hypothetical protein